MNIPDAAVQAREKIEKIAKYFINEGSRDYTQEICTALKTIGLDLLDAVNALPHLPLEIVEATKPVDVAAVRRQAFEEAASRLIDLAGKAREKVKQFHAKQHDGKYGDRKKKHFYEEKKHFNRLAIGYSKSVRAIRALSAEPAQGDQWQPIKTAPKDQLVIVYTPPQPHDHPAAFHVDFDYIYTGIADGYWYNHGEAREHFECVGKPDCWSGGISYDAPYTHWMPLPAAPTTEEGR